MRLNLSAFDAAIVDLDGTMVDTLGDFDAALNGTLKQMCLPSVAPAFIRLCVGKGSEHLIRQVLSQVGAEAASYDDAWALYQEHYLRVNGQFSTVYPGVEAGLQRLRARGLKLACLTNKPGDFAKPLLAAKQLQGYFEAVFGGDAFERKKPDPLPLLKTCAALGSTPARTLMVGDSSNGAKAARAAGCPVVLVSYGYNHGEDVHAAGADAVVGRLDELT